MFCATTASIVSGTLAERIKLWPFLIFVIVLTGFIYPITGLLAVGRRLAVRASWLLRLRRLDRGALVGGWAALAGAIVLGPRMGKYKDGKVNPMPGSNLPLATLGTFILWLGWFGFNGGSQLAMGTVGDVADVSRIFSNTNMAAAAGARRRADPDAGDLRQGRPDHGAERRAGRPRVDHRRAAGALAGPRR
jgi:Amt family ammonium transporter